MEDLKTLLSFKSQYHNHKETMAHAAMLVQAGLFVMIMNMKPESLEWIDCKCVPEQCLVVISYLVMWALISLYMCWQLKNRKIAANQVDDLIKAIKCENNNKTRKAIERMQDVRGNNQKPIMGEIILWIADVSILIMALFKIDSLF